MTGLASPTRHRGRPLGRLVSVAATVALLAALLAGASLTTAAADPATICPEPGSVEGVDVSQFQGTIDWAQVHAAGKVFAYVRASDGWWDDTRFLDNYAAAKAAGLQVGAYLRWHPSVDPAHAAEVLLAQLQRAGFAPGDLRPVVDVESTDGLDGQTILDRLQVTVDTLTSALGAPPVVYTAPGWWRSHVSTTDGPAGTDLWVANWNVTCPDVPAPWTTWSVWQYSSAGSVPGISGPVDLDRTNGPSLVTTAAQPLAFTAASPPTAQLWKRYVYPFRVAGVPRPTFSVASGSLPPGITVDPSAGVLNGPPQDPGTWTFTIRAHNGASPDAVTPPITLTVSADQTDHGYHSILPHRILESRPAFGAIQYATPWGPGTDRTVGVAGFSVVPASATAVALNITAVNATAETHLRVYPTGSPRPNASNVNLVPGQVVPNLVIARVGTGGSVQIYNNSGKVDVVADVVGWFTDGPSDGDPYQPVPPARILDTRRTDGWLQHSTPWGPGQDRIVQVTAVSGVPADAEAVALNVTALNATAVTDLRVYLAGVDDPPNASSLNVAPGEIVANLVIARVGLSGYLEIYNSSGKVDVIADVVGWFGPRGTARYHAVTPGRILETRPWFGSLQYATPWGPGTDRPVVLTGAAGVPAGAVAVAMNLTGVAASAITDERVYPDGLDRPTTSNLNLMQGRTRANLVLAPVGTAQSARIYNSSGEVDLVADVTGWFG